MTTNRTVATTIDTANAERAGAVVGYLPAGYPNLQTSVDAADRKSVV